MTADAMCLAPSHADQRRWSGERNGPLAANLPPNEGDHAPAQPALWSGSAGLRIGTLHDSLQRIPGAIP
jgi:hypothetical protein